MPSQGGREILGLKRSLSCWQMAKEVDWIVDQVLPMAAEADRSEMGQVLAEIAAAGGAWSRRGYRRRRTCCRWRSWTWPNSSKPYRPELTCSKSEGEMLRSPQGALLADFSAFCQERGFEGELGQAEMSEAMRELHEEWLQTPRPAH